MLIYNVSNSILRSSVLDTLELHKDGRDTRTLEQKSKDSILVKYIGTQSLVSNDHFGS